MLNFKSIPDTDLEIASQGKSHNRAIIFRTQGTVEPINIAEDVRIILIGNPEAKIRRAMSNGSISRPKLAELVPPIGGSTYQKLRVYVGKFV